MRGCFQNQRRNHAQQKAFPAYAGMFLRFFPLLAVLVRFPRVCGDVSSFGPYVVAIILLSPRMRGCFLYHRQQCLGHRAFPAYGGMFQRSIRGSAKAAGFPRVCGDVSSLSFCWSEDQGLSPRMRGCFLDGVRTGDLTRAFPAYAGMFPVGIRKSVESVGFPRVCGDVSWKLRELQAHSELSPRMRGCFQWYDYHERDQRAFPAYAGMFLWLMALA